MPIDSVGVILNLSAISLAVSCRFARIQTMASDNAAMVFCTRSRLFATSAAGGHQTGGRDVEHVTDHHEFLETFGYRFVVEGRRQHGAGNLLAGQAAKLRAVPPVIM